MSQIDPIVSVVIDVQSDSVARTSFGIPCVAGAFLTTKTTPAFTRARSYSSTAEMLLEGWTTSDEVYKAVAAIFSQNPRPASVVVGRRQLEETTPVALVADADWAAALTAIRLENDSWYALGIVPVSSADTEGDQVAAYIEADNSKLFFSQSSDATILAAGSGDTGSDRKAALYMRTATMYRAAGKASEHTELGWVGEGVPFEPGSSTWAYKQIAGSTADTLSSGQKSIAHGKNVNTYTLVAGVNITQNGVVASGEYIDVIIGIDALKAELQETVYGALTAQRKIDFDDGGITAVAGLVQGVLEKYGRQGVLQIDSIELTVPKYADIPTADKTARRLPDVKFRALLQGAIHLVEIVGTVSV